MNTLDYFCGTKSMAKVALKRGHKCLTLDNDNRHDPDMLADIFWTDLGDADYAHFSPPCTGFSVASIGKHWGGGHRAYIPKSDIAKLGIKILNRVAEIISKYNYRYWTIENPVSVFRKLMPDILKNHGINNFRIVTVTYCQYGDNRMKPTDFITNIPKWDGRKCKNGDSCHESAPRGAKTGTQGLKDAIYRGKIPSALFEEIFESIEDDFK